MIPGQSLVRYDNPVLVSRTDAKAAALGKPAAGPNAGAEAVKKVAGNTVAKKLPPVDDKGRAKSPTQTEDILNSILPPRYTMTDDWTVGGRARSLV